MINEYFFTGDFFSAWLYPAPPACVTASCDEELNVNFVLPELCCSMLPFGDFISFANETLDFFMPQFLSAALSEPACSFKLLSDTQRAYANLESTQKLRVNVFTSSASKLPYCNDTCQQSGMTQINLYLPSPCPGYCPSPALAAVRMDY